jgi:murein DD-endopeptidase MepM/ murein hydrolase activator NlpD
VRGLHFACLLAFPFSTALLAAEPREPLHRTIDLNRGETQQVQFSNGITAKVKLLDVRETRDSLRGAVRRAEVTVEINGVVTNLVSGNYHLPLTLVGVQVDCPVTGGYRDARNHRGNVWALEKDARLRLWPAGSSFLEPGQFSYPVKQRWFASLTQMGNEPTYVDGGDDPGNSGLYYHAGCDLGGCERLTEVVAASDGLIVMAHGNILPAYADLPFHEKSDGPDLIYVLEAHGWIHRYAHLRDVEPTVRSGARIKRGQRLGLLGKEGGSGGWSHLHFDIRSRQPSGQWGHQDGYAFLWEAYQREYQPELLAVARPHHLTATREKVVLDGSRSWSASGQLASYEWTLSDGTTSRGQKVERRYDQPGSFSETLKVTDDAGRVAYDFCVVQVIDPAHPKKLPPTLHATYAPTFGVKPGDSVRFEARTFRTNAGKETWNFGDGTPAIETHSDANANAYAADGYGSTTHRFEKPGDYVVSVERTGHTGAKAVARLHVHVGQQ